MAESVLKYQTLQSSIHISFWQELSKRKLEIFRLSTEPVSLIGKVQIANDPRLPSTVEISSELFSKVQVTAEKLAKQLLTRDAQATRAEEKNKDLKYQLEDLQNWSETAKKFIRNCKAEKLDMQNQFADRDRALVEREKKIKKREDEVEARVALLQTCAALEHELFIAKTQIKKIMIIIIIILVLLMIIMIIMINRASPSTSLPPGCTAGGSCR